MAATRVIEIRTEIPGPRSREILERERLAVAASAHRPRADRRRPRTRLDDHRRRRQHLRRLRRRSRRGERRAQPPARRRGDLRAGRSLPAHRFHRCPVRGLRGARRAARRAGSDPRRDARRVLQRRCRGGRERRQARTPLHEAASRHRVRRRVPRPHVDGADHDVQDAPVQEGARAVRARGLPHAVPERLSRTGRFDRARGARAPVHHVRRGGSRRCDRVRAAAGRGRLPACACGVRRRPACDLRPARDRARGGRGADRVRSHRTDVRDGALRRRAGSHDRREVHRRRPAAVRRDRPGGDHGRPAPGGDRRDVHR